MRKRVLTVYACVLLIFALGFGLGMQSATAPVQAQTSTYLSASPIPSTLHTTQVWMREPFCLRVWWYDSRGKLVVLCSEDKGTDTPVPGVSHKVDLPGPAALALIGKAERWELSAVALAKPDSQLPGDNFVRVTGPTLVTILNSVTPPPVFSATVTLLPTGTAASPTARVTPTSPPSLTPTQANPNIPTLTFAQKQAFTVYCNRSDTDYTMTIWGSYGLTYSVPEEWCRQVRDGAQFVLAHMAQATPARIEVRP